MTSRYYLPAIRPKFNRHQSINIEINLQQDRKSTSFADYWQEILTEVPVFYPVTEDPFHHKNLDLS